MFEIDFFHATDQRGSFTKTYQKTVLEKHGLVSDFEESFFSINKKGVIRGMHFQYPPMDHAKLVYTSSGRILDVILDLRTASPTYGKHTQIEISEGNHKGVYMPKGVAHGFCCLSDSTMIYLTSTEYNAKSESGVRWDSFGMEWPEKSPVLSERDMIFDTFNVFQSPF